MKQLICLLCFIMLSVPGFASAEERVEAHTETEASSLTLRLEAAFGLQHCINSDTGVCTRYPTSFESQDTGAYGRIGATLRLPAPLSFLSGGLLLDLGGFSLGTRRLTSSASVAMHLYGILRVDIPIEDERYEANIGLGFGLAHWSAGYGLSWTGMTIPVSVAMGYEVTDDLFIGGEVTFYPHIAGGGAPHSIQYGVYAAYRLDVPL